MSNRTLPTTMGQPDAKAGGVAGEERWLRSRDIQKTQNPRGRTSRIQREFLPPIEAIIPVEDEFVKTKTRFQIVLVGCGSPHFGKNGLNDHSRFAHFRSGFQELTFEGSRSLLLARFGQCEGNGFATHGPHG